jgi:hypothetical protein
MGTFILGVSSAIKSKLNQKATSNIGKMLFVMQLDMCSILLVLLKMSSLKAETKVKSFKKRIIQGVMLSSILCGTVLFSPIKTNQISFRRIVMPFD